MAETDNKRIAKNTMMLYIRMLVSIVVSLYTSRVVLQTLGIEDYGINGLVAGAVGMFSFLNSAMAGATSRFITFEMGRGDSERLCKTVSSALLIHICIGIILVILAETVGLWFLHNKLVIPESRLDAASFVFQFCVLGLAISVIQVPYNATIIAHEKMDIYAYVELLHVFLKLGIVYLLVIGNLDKLKLYAVLTLVVNIIIVMTYMIYCIKHYKETHFNLNFDKGISKSIMSFSLYNLFGNMGYVVNTQGTAFVINMFFGVLYNAAAAVGTTISSVVTGFSGNIMTAFRPPITKAYATNDIGQFQYLLLWAIKSILIVYSFVAIPIGFLVNELLSLWLVEVPMSANIFCQLLLVSIFFESIRHIIIIGIHATGIVKFVSVFTGLSFCLNPFIIYGLYSFGLPPAYAYVSVIGINIFLTIANIFILKHNENRVSVCRIMATILKVLIVDMMVIFIMLWAEKFKGTNSYWSILMMGGFSCVLISFFSYVCILNKIQREQVRLWLINKTKK